jgi:hypothetical protein
VAATLIARSLHTVEAALGWLIAYPLFPLQVLLFLLVAWGRLGYGLGADDLFWSESISEQFFNGLTCGLLFGQLFLVRYLLDPNPEKFRFRLTLLPVADPAVNRLGQYLALLWVPSLVILGGCKLFSRIVWEGPIQTRVWPLYVGLTLSVVVASGLIVLVACSGLLSRLASPRSKEIGSPEAELLSPRVQEASLHGIAMLTAGLYAVGILVIYICHFAGAVLSPVVVVCVLLGFANAVYGFVAFRLPGFQYVILILLIGLGLLANSRRVDPDNAYSLTFPGLEPYYGSPVEIGEGPKGREGQRSDAYYALLEKQATDPAVPKPDLIPSEVPVRRMCERWQAQRKDKTKPRLVIVCTSGGGIRAAVWTAVVLEGLEREMLPNFREHVRLFTGASGGMVGAGLYVTDFERPAHERVAIDGSTGLGVWSTPLAQDSLRRTVQTMLLTDFPALWRPGRVAWDRGRELERVWAENTAVLGNGRSPFSRPFGELADSERDGRRPSLIFSPMLVEDARRLLVSNLDLKDLTWTSGGVVGFKPFNKRYPIPKAPDKPLLSLSAVELFRLFPESRGTFEVGTAARMNASFPLVSPAVNLPTNPPRRVVDAGYYDNFGVNLAAMWLQRHEQVIRDYTSGVVVIEIRAFRNGYSRWHFQDQEAEKLYPNGKAPEGQENNLPRRDSGALAASLEWLSTPAEAVSVARTRAAYYRNDELLDALSRHFQRETNDPDFFTTVAFECEVDAALSWTLPREEARLIAHSFQKKPEAPLGQRETRPWINTRLKALESWFGTGGR